MRILPFAALAGAVAAACGSPPKTTTVGAVNAPPEVGLTADANGGRPVRIADASADASRENSGVWVEIYENEQFDKSGLYTRVYGPNKFVTLEDIHGHDWDDEVNSVIVGPNAQVTLFRDEDFQDDNVVIGPGQKVPRLRDYDLEDEVQSMRIVAVKPPAAPVVVKEPVIVKEKEPVIVREKQPVVVKEPVVVQEPVVVGGTAKTAGAADAGCWVELFDEKGFAATGERLRLTGPIQIASLEDHLGKNWEDKIESLVVGPDAQVVVYSEPNFMGQSLTLTPGQRVSDLDAFDFGDDIESLKVTKAR